MRILHVVQELTVGGAERVVVGLVASAQAEGDEVAVAAAPGPLAAEISCPIYPLPLLARRPQRLPGGAIALGRAVRSFRPDLVHCHNPAMAAIGGIVTRRGRRPPALVTVQGVPDGDYPRAARVLRWSGIPVVACGPGVAAALADHGLAVRAVVPNGVAAAPASCLDIGELRREWKLPDGSPVLLCVGRLEPQKNHAAAIRALVHLPGASLVVLGAGSLRGELEDLSRRLGVGERVALPGVRRDARAVMAAVDVVLLPSEWEGLPLAGLEALLAGTPLVAADVRGIREVLEDGRHCLLVPPHEPEALAAAVRRLLDDRSLAERLVTAGAALAGQFSEAAMVARYRTLYRDLLRSR